MDSNCTVCKKSFDPESLIHFEDAEVCAGCKPEYLQRIKEGIDTIDNRGDIEQKGTFFTRPTCPDCAKIVSRRKICGRTGLKPFSCETCGTILKKYFHKKFVIRLSVYFLLIVSPYFFFSYIITSVLVFKDMDFMVRMALINALWFFIGMCLFVYYFITYIQVKKASEEDPK